MEYLESNKKFDLNKFSKQIFAEEDESDKFKLYLNSNGIDEKFDISSNAVTKIKKTIKKRIRLDDNVEINFDATVDDVASLIEKGYDKEKKKKYYKIYYNDED